MLLSDGDILYSADHKEAYFLSEFTISNQCPVFLRMGIMQPVWLQNSFCLLAVPECPIGQFDLQFIANGILDNGKETGINC